MFYRYFTYITADNDVAGAVKTRLAREYYILYAIRPPQTQTLRV